MPKAAKHPDRVVLTQGRVMTVYVPKPPGYDFYQDPVMYEVQGMANRGGVIELTLAPIHLAGSPLCLTIQMHPPSKKK